MNSPHRKMVSDDPDGVTVMRQLVTHIAAGTLAPSKRMAYVTHSEDPYAVVSIYDIWRVLSNLSK